MNELIRVRAHLELFAGDNMRRTPFFSKYRPVFDFKQAGTKISGSIDLIDRESFKPGTSGIVQITFLKGMISDNYFRKGETFLISEGRGNNLGKGEILEIINS